MRKQLGIGLLVVTFDQQAFHDFVLAQGLLPPDILKNAVMNEFVPSQLN